MSFINKVASMIVNKKQRDTCSKLFVGHVVNEFFSNASLQEGFLAFIFGRYIEQVIAYIVQKKSTFEELIIQGYTY